MTLEEKIKMLNDYAISWYSTSQQDSLHEAVFRNMGFGKFADRCKAEAEDELEEAKKCTNRVVELGGKPAYGFVPLPVFDDPKDLLSFWDQTFTEGQAVETLNRYASQLSDDVITRKLIEEFAEDESDHIKWVKQHLNLIEKIGYENYLIEMMDI